MKRMSAMKIPRMPLPITIRNAYYRHYKVGQPAVSKIYLVDPQPAHLKHDDVSNRSQSHGFSTQGVSYIKLEIALGVHR